MPRFVAIMPRLPVADLARAVAFYETLLGFRTTVRWPADTPTFAILDRDAIRLGLHGPGGVGTPPLAPGELHFDVTDIRGLHESLKDRLTVEWGPEVFFYGRREFAVRDPDGHLLIFSEPTTDPPTCPDE